MGKAYLHGGQSVNATLLGGHPGSWYERPNPNLLINGDFRGGRLINQQGQTEYTVPGYSIDGWQLHAAADITLEEQGVRLICGQDDTYGFLRQPLEDSMVNNILSQTVTFTACINGTNYSATGTMPDNLTDKYIEPMNKKPGPLRMLIAFQNQNRSHVRWTCYTGSDELITRAKLEIGDHFTGWTETDPGEELVKCRRRYVRWGPYEKAGLAFGSSTTTAAGYIPIPQMRATPVLRFSNLTLGNSRDVTGMTLSISGPNMIELAIASNVTSGLTYNIRVAAGGYLELDARL